MAVKPIPEGYHTVTPYLIVKGAAQALEFYQKALGFRLSDWIGDFMVFLRCNSAHHRVAILPGPPALNHIAFDVSSVDELMRGLARMHENGIKLSWGPGRHTAVAGPRVGHEACLVRVRGLPQRLQHRPRLRRTVKPHEVPC